MKHYFKRILKAFWRNDKTRVRLQKAAIWYFRLVRRSCQVQVFPREFLDLAAAHKSYIIATWHGQNYLLPFALDTPNEIRVLAATHKDGQFFAGILAQLGFDVILGSGAGINPRDIMRKRSLAAFEEMLTALQDDCAIALTADVPKFPRLVGNGIMKLAYYSGRPIVPVAVRTSHTFSIPTWDKTLINLPFGRLTVIIGNPIFVTDTADQDLLESKRLELEVALNSVNAHAVRACTYWRL